MKKSFMQFILLTALAGGMLACARAAEVEKRVVIAGQPGSEDTVDPTDKSTAKQHKMIERHAREMKDVAWLGVGIEEASDALAAQLGFHSGEGLVVTFVAPDSPGAKAGLQKNDVLTELDDQLLVHPGQFRKLIRLHKEGDSVKLTYYRGGKKDTVSATLGKTSARVSLLEDSSLGELGDLKHQIEMQVGDGLRQEMKQLHESLARAGVDREKLSVEIKRSLEEANHAIREASRNIPNQKRELARVEKELEALARAGVSVDKDATVVVKSDRNSVKTVVKTDEGGSYVIIANPNKRLTARDKDGKVLFDGPIDTSEQQEKVPKEVWEKVKPMLDKIGTGSEEKSEAEGSDKKPSL